MTDLKQSGQAADHGSAHCIRRLSWLCMQGEFEAGFEQGGQTREHAHLAKTLGVTKLIVAVNKMDDPSILPEDGVWPKSRYDEIVSGLTPFLRQCGCVPCSPLPGSMALSAAGRMCMCMASCAGVAVPMTHAETLSNTVLCCAFDAGAC